MEQQNDNISEKVYSGSTVATLSHRSGKWVSSGIGGLVGAIGTILVIVIPVVNTWLANTKEISLAQIQNSADQIKYAVERMKDSDKERDLYKSEMLACQKELRELKLK